MSDLKVEVVASTKVGNIITKDEALDFGAKAAGVCYMADTFAEIMNEPSKKTKIRIERTVNSGHHSVYSHTYINLLVTGVPKILAAILNNERSYNTSEKSGRYTVMASDGVEKELYDKWFNILVKVIKEKYDFLQEGKIQNLAKENARLFISAFTPATTFIYSTDFRQLNYIIQWFEDYIKNESDTEFNIKLKEYMKDFIDQLSIYKVEGLDTRAKSRKISFFDDRDNRAEYFGEVYSTNYEATLPHLGQALRHRTLIYRFKLQEDNVNFFVPYIFDDYPEYAKDWLKDMQSIKHLYPQGMLWKVNERGTYEDFILKCKERLCGHPQVDITKQTKATLEKYIDATRETNKEVYEILKQYNGPKCTFKDSKCLEPCPFGPKGAFTRKI